ncbi:DUF1223 domain-containing protein [Chitinophaga arvensicola]|uniref:DUF1223 domain-containing protein n=1 Tax=Chitinophaga arvensicola TaxID=29529 RepID=A0A1I0NA24_9BACT|nr:DUF1223 domain-containing protein [Chitinophaga arvensicola]SEV97725.1 Protein of unknown function [Chitinophaga arvensicola]
MNQVKKSAIGAAFVLSLITALFVSRSIASKKQDHPGGGNGFAVLELFTSEGCSSCPPADALLARIQQEAGNKPIYILAYHVDYWNRLGWKDIFSNPQYSKRQYQYSEQLTGQVYTPQLVINGKSSCIGSDESAVNSGLSEALSGATGLGLDIKGQLQPGKVKLNYQLTGDARNTELLIAVVQKHAVSKVARGENEGRTLSHVQIVRDLQTFRVGADRQGSVQITLPGDFTTQEWELIGMIQQPKTGVMEAATRVVVSQ